MNITEVSTIYFNADAIRLQPYKVGRVSFGDGRAYFKFQLPAKIYTSLTTVTSTCSPMPYGLMKWKMSLGEKESARVGRVAAMYGTLMHETIGTFCINQSFNFDKAGEIVSDYLSKNEFYDNDTSEWTERLKEDMQAWADFVYRHKVNVIAVEMVLCSDQFEFATAIDIVCDMTIEEKGFYGDVYKSGDKKDQPKESKKETRIRAIINLKSGRHGFYQENANQLELERMVWNENYPDIKIDRIYNWAPTEWRDYTGEKWRLADQTNKANKVEMEAMLMLASERYKGKNEQKMYTNIYGEIYYGNDPTANITQIRVVDHLEKRIKDYLSKKP
jgi:hypothetical protein